MRKILIIIFCFALNFTGIAEALGPITNPPSPPDGYIITSPDGHVQIGVSKHYGGAIVYYKDDRIPDGTVANGNMIDYSNGGTLFTTPVWTLPPNISEQNFCYENQKSNGVCPASLPFNNPTQGGYFGDGWAGNPNPTAVSISNNEIYVVYRGVNYNYAYNPVKPLAETNRHEWQTDFWGEIRIYFHPVLTDVGVVETKIVYCRDMNISCRDKWIVTQDNQLNTLFTPGSTHPNPEFYGPYGRAAYRSMTGNYKITGFNQSSGTCSDNAENWVAMLQKDANAGIGISVQNYEPLNTSVGNCCGSSMWLVPFINAIQPKIENFERFNVTKVYCKDVGVCGAEDTLPRYKFGPGGWYKFRTYVATGNIDQIRSKLLSAHGAEGYFDAADCNTFGGWAKDIFNPSNNLSVKIRFEDESNESNYVEKFYTANKPRGDLISQGICPTCAFSELTPSDVKNEFPGKKIKVYAYAISTQGSHVKLGNSPMTFGPCTTDQTPPSTTISCNDASCSTSWYAANVKITLTCADSGGSGCSKTYYCVDQSNSCSPSTEYSSPFYVTSEGTNYVRYYSKDNAGNSEGVKNQSVNIDKTLPVVSVSITPDLQSVNVIASVSCSDNRSGCNESAYVLKIFENKTNSCPSEYAFYDLLSPHKFSGRSWVCGAAKDFAGNVNFSALVEFKNGDVNDDGKVDISDLTLVALNFGKTSGFDPVVDIVQNGEIDIYDVVFVASRFT